MIFKSQWCSSSTVSTAYAIYRFALAAILLVSYATLITWKLIEGHLEIFIYLTNLSYILLVLHFTIEAIIVLKRWITEKLMKNWANNSTSLPVSYKVSWILQSMVFSSSLIVSLMYVIFVHPIWIQKGYLGNLNKRYAYLFGHIINSLICFVDIFISNRPWKFMHFIWPLMFGLSYVIFTLIIWTVGFEATFYDQILDWNEPCQAIVTIAILAVSVPLVHLFWMGLAKLRRQIYQKMQEKKTHPTTSEK